jgi:hypothetical protein
MGTVLAVALALSAAHRPVVVYHYHTPASHNAVVRHHAVETRRDSKLQRHVEDFRREILSH